MAGSRRRSNLTGSIATSALARWTQPGGVKVVQRGTLALGAGQATATSTITAVDVNCARLRLLGCTLPIENNNQIQWRIALTNGTTVTLTANTASTSGGSANFEVIEYFPGVIKSVQRTTGTPGAVTITTVNTAKTELDYLGSSNSDGTTGVGAVTRVTLTNATTVTVSAASLGTATASFQVVEWF